MPSRENYTVVDFTHTYSGQKIRLTFSNSIRTLITKIIRMYTYTNTIRTRTTFNRRVLLLRAYHNNNYLAIYALVYV